MYCVSRRISSIYWPKTQAGVPVDFPARTVNPSDSYLIQARVMESPPQDCAMTLRM
jgi:hypothetical protein